MDYVIRELKKELIEVLNKRFLPLEVKRMVMQELLIEISRLANQVVEEQIKQAEQTEAADDTNTDEKGE